jgi:quinol monooxygenase YgiN
MLLGFAHGKGDAVYGTVARMKVKHDNVEKLRELMQTVESRRVEGFVGTYILVPDTWHDEILMVAMFEDRLSYMKNADDPRMHEDYVKYRALLEEDPEWTDGEWFSFPSA